jgi:hypothetical protein
MKSNILYHAKFAIVALFLLLGALSVEAQIQFRIRLESDGVTYTVLARPKPGLTPAPSLNTLTGTGQITLVVPNGFQYSNFVSLAGLWGGTPGPNGASRVNAPVDNPNNDYISIGFISDGPIQYIAGSETALFRLRRTSACTGPVELIEDDDPFAAPNSLNSNPGNEISVFDFGNGFALYTFDSNYGSAPACADSDADGLFDFVEDKNGNSVVDPGETNPNNPDTDGDGLADGIEDANKNGVVDAGESNPTNKCSPNATFPECDFDGDGIVNSTDTDDDKDGVADAQDVQNFNADSDSDFDGISDDDETGGDGIYNPVPDSDPLDPCDPNASATACTAPDNDNDGFFGGMNDPNDNNPCIPSNASNACDFDNDGTPNGSDLDDDNDGVADVFDLQPTNPNNDSDSDGLTNNVETGGDGVYNTDTDTNPLDADTDNDGITDGIEDTDKDGSRDPNETDALLSDTDNDGLEDGEEDANFNGTVDINESDPLDDCDPVAVGPLCDYDGDGMVNEVDPDDDNDGLADASDVNDHNPSSDSDGDGLTDLAEHQGNTNALNACDPNPTASACVPDDSDADLFFENYPTGHPKFDPLDTNPCVPSNAALVCDFDQDGQINQNDSDDDNDGVGDLFDNEDYNPMNDSDGDGLPNKTEVGANGIYNAGIDTNPLSDDTDNDQLKDGCEDKNKNGQKDADETSPLAADTDGDGLKDGVEDANKNCILDPNESDPLSLCSPNNKIGGCDFDLDGTVNSIDLDDDNDGVADIDDIDQFDPESDTDDDGIVDNIETGEDGEYNADLDTNPLDDDSDDDGIKDGTEDKNRNGLRELEETDPLNSNSDGDTLADGDEDINFNGVIDVGESDPLDPCSPFSNGGNCDNVDLDNDGFFSDVPSDNPLFDPNDNLPCVPLVSSPTCDFDGDGIPNQNDLDDDHDGVNDAQDADDYNPNNDNDNDGLSNTIETGGDGVFNNGVDTHPLNPDSDADGIKDGTEDKNKNGDYEAQTETNPLKKDSDGDGIDDGIEDINKNGVVNQGESDPKNICSPYTNHPGLCLPTDIDGDGYFGDFPPNHSDFDPNDNNACLPDPTSPVCDFDNDSVVNSQDFDDDNDGVIDTVDEDPYDPNSDTDDDGISDNTETGGNGVYDPTEGDSNPLDPCSPSQNNIACSGTDEDNDGYYANFSTSEPLYDPDDANPCIPSCAVGICDFDGDSNINSTDNDDDNDGVRDNLDVDDCNIHSDSDGDGLSDSLENGGDGAYNAGVDTNPSSPDTDNDGLEDGVEDANKNGEVDLGETNPLIADTDSDGIRDGIEDSNRNGQVDPGESDPLDKCSPNNKTPDCDYDGDGQLNSVDNDDDNDGVNDAQDVDDFNPESDSDSDNVVDIDETSNNSNPLNPCDPNTAASTCQAVDVDNDGFASNFPTSSPNFDPADDNPCVPSVASGSCDFDGDGRTNATDSDDDGDGVADVSDVNPYDKNSDSDGDMIPDNTETQDDSAYDGGIDSNPLDTDTDDDGLADGTEDANHNGEQDATETSTVKADTDEDGLSDSNEVTSGTDPLDHCDPNATLAACDFDGDGQMNSQDQDDDNDGVADGADADAYNPNSDSDEDGLTDIGETNGSSNPLNACDPNTNATACQPKDEDGDYFFENYPANSQFHDPNDNDPCVPSPGSDACDFDEDGLVNSLDSDDDNDGVADAQDVWPYDPNSDSDGDGITDVKETKGDGGYNAGLDSNPLDTDTDDDGIFDGVEDANKNGLADFGETSPVDEDSDNDSINDGVEDSNKNGMIDAGESDPLDFCDPNATKPSCDFDGDGLDNNTDTDDDNDCLPDVSDVDPFDAASDSDDDGLTDMQECQQGSNPLNPCSPAPVGPLCSGEVDLDGDGYFADVTGQNPTFDPNDANPCVPSHSVGVCDFDQDGQINSVDADDDNDCVDDAIDADDFNVQTDSDNDGSSDGNECEQGSDPLNPCSPVPTGNNCGSQNDFDGDGYLNDVSSTNPLFDPNDGNPCVPNNTVGNCDFDQDGQANSVDADDDNDCVLDDMDANDYNDQTDSDADGIVDATECDNGSDPLNGCDPSQTGADCDCDNDGTANGNDTDDDNDGVADSADSDDCNPNNDSDNDGISNKDETLAGSDPLDPCDPNENSAACLNPDADGDGFIANQDDPDDNNPCIPNNTVGVCDFDQDGQVNSVDEDDDNDCLGDIDDINAYDAQSDTDFDGISDADECENGTNALNQCDPKAEFLNCDFDGDGLVNSQDPDDDNDCVADAADPDDFNPDSDTDLDGITDSEECQADTDPEDACDPNPSSLACTGTDNDGDGFIANAPTSSVLYDPNDNDACVPSHLVGACDFDKDGQANSVDGDDDNDGVADNLDINAYDPESDTDGDGIVDNVETGGDSAYNVGVDSNPLDTDTDDDGLSDGIEDKDKDGQMDEGETDPVSNDTDEDGLRDNEEDANLNGQVDPGESDPANPDDDNDGILTIDEDTNGNGDVTDDDTDLDGKPDFMDPDPFAFVRIKAYLQAPLVTTTGLMDDKLRTKLDAQGRSYIPLTEPYTNLQLPNGTKPFTHLGSGGETIQQSVLDVTGSNAIVDWVFLELRSKLNPANELLTRAALLQRDGDIVDLDGVSPVVFKAKIDDYYIALRHRNHLGVMTASARTVTRSKVDALFIDFTSPNTPTYVNPATPTALPQKTMGNYRALWAGNAYIDNKTMFQGANSDRNAIFSKVFFDSNNTNGNFNFIVHGYYPEDTNMDGRVIYQGSGNDVDQMIFFNVLLHPNNTSNVVNYQIFQQLP